MADGGWTTLGELEDGTVFEAHPEDSAAPGILAVKSEYHYPDGACQCVLLASGEYAHFRRRNATRVRPLDLPALLKELNELRALTHDLLIDRDAAYGREVGRGEALAAAKEAREKVLAVYGYSQGDAAGALRMAFEVIQALGPVRPLPPPERLAARCRALEDALRGLALEADAAGRYVEVGLGDCPGGKLDVALDAARKLLEERGSGT